MTHAAYIKMWCDWPGCYAAIDTARTKLTDARKEAEKSGWKIIPGIVDLCGDQAKRTDGPDLLRWHGHAERTDHSPVTKPAKRTGERASVHLSCLCKWVYETPYDWMPAGTVSRDMVGFYWAKHVKELPPATAEVSGG